MKTFYIVALSVLCLLPTIAGTAVSAERGQRIVTSLDLMKAQAASSDAILSRPL